MCCRNLAESLSTTGRRLSLGRTRCSSWLWLAVVCGGIHTGFSAAWALGSDALLGTVGSIADKVASFGVGGRMGLLGAIAGAKLTVVVLLVAETWGVPRSPRLRALIRLADLVLGGGLLLYGAVSMTGSGVGLWMELNQPDPDPAALVVLWGHLAIWDLLFALWGLGTVMHTMRCQRTDGGCRDSSVYDRTNSPLQEGPHEPPDDNNPASSISLTSAPTMERNQDEC